MADLLRRLLALRSALWTAAFFLRLRMVARLKGVELDLVVGPGVVLGRGVAVQLGGRRVRWVLGAGTAIADAVRFHLVDAEVIMGPGVGIKRECLVHVYGGRLVFEGSCGLSQRCIVHCADEISVGKWTAVSECATLVDSEHQVPLEAVERNWLRSGEVETAPIRIGRYVLIGAKATILKGVTVGDHSILAANSLLVRNLPEHSIGIGVPARRIRRPGAPSPDAEEA